MEILAERTPPNLDGIRAALSDLQNNYPSMDAVPRVAGSIAVELHKLLIEDRIIEALPVPHMISGDSHFFEIRSKLSAELWPDSGPAVRFPDTSNVWAVVVGPLPLLRYAGDDSGTWIISTKGFAASLPTDDWLKQKIATVEQTGRGERVVTARDLISVVRNTMGAHAQPDPQYALLHNQFRAVEGGQEGTSYPFWFCIALGVALCGYAGIESRSAVELTHGQQELIAILPTTMADQHELATVIGEHGEAEVMVAGDADLNFDWAMPNIRGESRPLGVSMDDRIVIQAHASVPWLAGASREDRGPQFSFGPRDQGGTAG